MNNLSTVLRESYDGQWTKFPCPTETLEDYDNIVWLTDIPPTVENLKDLGVFPTIADRVSTEPIRILRIKRNALLVETDWVGLSDLALTNEKAAEWKMYRQKLRDLPSGLDTVDKVNAVIWPEKPE